MLDKYLRNEETILSRLDDLLDQARRTNSATVTEASLREAQVLATLYGAGRNAQGTVLNTIHVATAEPLEGVLEGVYGLDQVAEALDNAFEGGQAPAALKGAVLAILTHPGDDPMALAVIGDSSLVPPLADGSTPMVEGDAAPYVDASGVDFDQTMPDTLPDDLPDHELADRLEDEAEDFPEFVTGGTSRESATVKPPKKKGGKKTAAQRAAEEAGL